MIEDISEKSKKIFSRRGNLISIVGINSIVRSARGIVEEESLCKFISEIKPRYGPEFIKSKIIEYCDDKSKGYIRRIEDNGNFFIVLPGFLKTIKSPIIQKIEKNDEIKDKIKNKNKKNKTISISYSNYQKIIKIKDELIKKNGGKISNDKAITKIMNDYVDLINIKKELLELKKDKNDTQEYIKEMLKLSLIQTQTYQYNPNLLTNSELPLQKPPSPPSILKKPVESIIKSKKQINYKPPNTGNLKKDYINEIKQVFTGEIVKPSDILKITKPKHIDTKIKDEIKGNDNKVIDIFEKSIVSKNLEKFTNQRDD